MYARQKASNNKGITKLVLKPGCPYQELLSHCHSLPLSPSSSPSPIFSLSQNSFSVSPLSLGELKFSVLYEFFVVLVIELINHQ
jgi:hypothetical protein